MPHRERKRTFSSDKKSELADLAAKYFERDNQDRQIEMDMRAQRYAKFRQWRFENMHAPWADSSDAAVSDIMRHSLKTQDVLYNAVMSSRPIMTSKATNEKDKERQEAVDQITDYQALVENGETWISDLIDAFVNDGHFTAFVPWVDERRTISLVKMFDPIPEEQDPPVFLAALVQSEFEDALTIEADGESGWDFAIDFGNDEHATVSFYTDERKNLEMVTEREVTVFQGNKIIIKDRADVLHPVHVANLQAPGPSNPGGASHVALVDRLTVDEVRRLQASGFYDELTREDVDALELTSEVPEKHPEQTQKNVIQGADENRTNEKRDENLVTRLMVFDVVDMGNGRTEDVVYWTLYESKKLARVRRLSEAFPSRTGRRPLAEEQFVPVRGRRTGIGIIEQLEGIHDLTKQTFDQALDYGSLMLTPWGFYRPASSLRPEVIKLSPGDLYPTADPKNDVNFPSLPAGGQAYAFNLLTMLEQQEEKLTLVGDLQLGRVPKGKSSALRTVGGQQMISGQGASRPERVLRRLFNGLAQIWSIMHENNVHFLTGEKEIAIHPDLRPAADAYRVVDKRDLSGTMMFEFQANAFNTSKELQQEALVNIGQAVVMNPLMLQAGIIDGQGIGQFAKDFIKSWGSDPNKYLSPQMATPLVTAEEAILAIMSGEQPSGLPREGAMGHLQQLQIFANSENFGFLNEAQVAVFQQWVEAILGALQVETQQAALAQAAGGQQQQRGGAGDQVVDNTQAPLEENELQDETLPSAGGGANTGETQ